MCPLPSHEMGEKLPWIVGRVPSMNQSVMVGSPDLGRRPVKAETVPEWTSDGRAKSSGGKL